jgi:hypothetical protein
MGEIKVPDVEGRCMILCNHSSFPLNNIQYYAIMTHIVNEAMKVFPPLRFLKSHNRGRLCASPFCSHPHALYAPKSPPSRQGSSSYIKVNQATFSIPNPSIPNYASRRIQPNET